GHEQATGVVEVEMADRHEVDRGRVEAGASQRGNDRVALHASDPAHLLVVALPDAGLDEDTTARRLDEQAVQGLDEAPFGIELRADEAVPEESGHRPEDRAGVGAER